MTLIGVIITLVLATATTEAAAQQKLYWSVPGTIYRTNLDGSGIEPIVTGLARVPAIAIDPVAGKLYWSNFNPPPSLPSGKLQRADLDGSNVEDLISVPVGGLALDLSASIHKMYWVDGVNNRIQRSNLDGTALEDVLTTIVDDPYGLAFDLADNRMYWADIGSDASFRSRLDGSDVQPLQPGLANPGGVALDLAAAKLYVATDTGIVRSSLDGSSPEAVVTYAGRPSNMVVYGPGDQIFWTRFNDGRLYRADLDGTNVQVLVSGVPAIEALAITPQCGNGAIEPPEMCDDGNQFNGDGCDGTCLSTVSETSTPTWTPTAEPTATPTATPVCPVNPLPGCREAANGSFRLKQRGLQTDKLLWRLTRVPATLVSEFGDPTVAADYSLCLYAADPASIVAQVPVPAGPDHWRAHAGGYSYRDPGALAGGIVKIKLKASASNSGKVLVKGVGIALPAAPLPITPPLTIQLVHQGTGLCWGAEYEGGEIRSNSTGDLSAFE